MGIYLSLAVVIPLLVGLRIDDAHHSTPVGFGLGLLIGILAGFSGLYLRFRRYL
jgi:F0F1-type ATP synthase assembly protein I